MTNELIAALDQYNTITQAKFEIQRQVNDLFDKFGYVGFKVQDNLYVSPLGIWIHYTSEERGGKLYNFPIDKFTLDTLAKGLSEKEVARILMEKRDAERNQKPTKEWEW